MKIKTKKIVTTHRKTNPDATKAQKFGSIFNIAAFYTTFALLAAAWILPLCENKVWGIIDVFLFIIACILVAICIATMIVYLFNRHTFSKPILILNIVLAVLTLSQIPLAVIRSYRAGYRWGFDDETFCLRVIVAVFCVVAFLLITSSIIISILTHQNKYVIVIKDVKITSNLEMELSETKRLLDFNCVTQEEYENLRKSVIAKYTRD